MKYILGKHATTGYWVPVVFGDEMIHQLAALALKKSNPRVDLISAGFVHFDQKERAWVVGSQQSDSLKLGPTPDDELVLNLFLGQGLAGLDLNNMIAFLAIQRMRSTGGR